MARRPARRPGARRTRRGGARPGAGRAYRRARLGRDAEALVAFLERDARLAAYPSDAEVVLWFEDDLYDAPQFAQLGDRLAGRPGPVTRVVLPHDRGGGLEAAFAARERVAPDGAAFAALRSPDPRAGEAVPA